MRPEDMDAIARVIAQQVKKAAANLELPKHDSEILDLVAGLEKRLDEALDMVAELTERLDTTTGERTALLNRVTALEEGNNTTDDMLNGLSDSIKHLKACDEARAKETTALEERLDIAKQVSDACDTLWDEHWKHQVAAMIPDLDEHFGKRLEVDELQIDLAVTKALKNYDLHAELAEMIPAPVKGEDGVDRPVVDVVTVDEGERVEKGTMVTHNGGLWMAKRKSKGTPTEDVGSYLLAVNGVDFVCATQEDERTVKFTTRYTDGEETSDYIDLRTVEHKGLWKIGEVYDVNDEVALNGGTYRSVVPDNTDRPGDSATWKTVAQRGKTGKGAKGDSVKGEPGRGIKEMLGSKQGDTLMLAVMYTDDTEEIIEVPIVDAEGDDE